MDDYKKYALGQLENFLHDCMNTETSAQEIYDVIKSVVEDNYYTYKNSASQAYELLALLNGEGKGHIEAYDAVMREKEYYEPSMPPWGHSDLEYLVNQKEDKVVKWILPVQQKIEEGIDDYYVQFPDDLLETANLKEGDQVEWIDRGDGSFEMRKVNGIK
jgi:hypothetical protein